jgi:IclR family acetate operon transcriptional repressor
VAKAIVDDRDEARPTGAQAIERAMALLNVVASAGPEGVGITEIAASTQLRVSTAHRIARALAGGGLMEQDRDTDRYRLGPTLHLLGQRAASQLGYRDARAVLDDLAATTGESASFGVRRGRDVQVVLVAPSAQRLRYDHELGGVIPLHASAMGKVLLSGSSGDRHAELASLGRLQRFTGSTVTTRAKLADELDEIRTKGYATNVEERHAGVVGIAAPVRDAHDQITGAVGVQGPAARFDADRVAVVAQAVIAAGHRLSQG